MAMQARASSSSSSSVSISDYFQGLDKTAQSRYQEKLHKLGGLQDPYLSGGQGLSAIEWQNWPKVEYFDIYNFLIE